MSNDSTSILGKAFDIVIKNTYGDRIAPEPIITPFGIAHLDAILGGGLVSSTPILFNSSPETGKSTIAFQFASTFQKIYGPDIATLYIDIEGSGSAEKSEYRISRAEAFGLDSSSFIHQRLLLDVTSVFGLISKIIETKKLIEAKQGREYKVLVVWDSVASTSTEKSSEVDDPNKMIGHKGRVLSHMLDKYLPLLKFNKITFIVIDQMRANISIEGPYAQKEKTVGTFKDMKSATGIFSLQHHSHQWLFLSRKKDITHADEIGVDGWYMDIQTVKNKLAPSNHRVRCVFDKNRGLDKFWSEYTFLSEYTPEEAVLYKKKKAPFPLMIKDKGSYKLLQVVDPNNPQNTYTSDTFYKKTAKSKYENDETFRKWFDYAVTLSVYNRITNGLFKVTQSELVELVDEPEDQNADIAALFNAQTDAGENYNTDTGEVEELEPSTDGTDYGDSAM